MRWVEDDEEPEQPDDLEAFLAPADRRNEAGLREELEPGTQGDQGEAVDC